MKTIKGLVTFVLLNTVLGACFNPPEFSTTPTIRYENVVFKENPDPNDKDSLVITLNFQDGDGDLGLGDQQIEDPFHFTYYYLVNGGDTIPVSTFSPRTDYPPMISVPKDVTGKLVTKRTPVEEPEYEDMFPDYICPFENTRYSRDSVYVLEENASIIGDANVHRVVSRSPDFQQRIYVLSDTFAIRENPYHYNIRVDFLIKQNDQTFVPFSWKTSCGVGQEFWGRFPTLSDNDNPLEGTLRYAMGTVGFHQLFDGKTLKLRIRIWDRALHVSNVIETPQFTLQDIME